MKKHTTALLAVFLLALSVSAQGQQKNILFIAVDDLKPLLSNYGYSHMHTPNFDRLAAMGVTFTNAHVQQAVCGPSRASVMTGTTPDRSRVWDLHTDFRESNPDLMSMPEYLIAQGYESTGIGKIYHKSSTSPGHDGKSWTIPHVLPNGNDPVHGEPALGVYQDPTTKAEMKRVEEELRAKGRKGQLRDAVMKKVKPSTEMADVTDEAYQDGAYAAEAVKRMNTLAKGDKPFFLAVGFQRPHLPFNAPKKYWDLYRREDIQLNQPQTTEGGTPRIAFHNFGELRSYTDIPKKMEFGELLPEAKQRELIHGYMACVSYIDAQLGKLLDEYERLGLDKNTVIVLWGDHGFHLGDHTIWCKHSNFEQATRIPFMFAGPGMAQGIKVDHPVELLDLFPTVFELVGIEKPAQAEGISLLPLMDKDKKTMVEKDYAISQFPRKKTAKGYTIRTARYRYTEWHDNNYNSHLPYDGANIIGTELYDYEKDPTESTNFAKNEDYKAVKAEMKAKLKKHLQSKENPNSRSAKEPIVKESKQYEGNKDGDEEAAPKKKGKGKQGKDKAQKKKLNPTPTASSDRSGQAPNILFVIADDLGYHDLSCTGSQIYQTPNIDRLAAQSLDFERAYSSYPRCTPSRYAIMTATYPIKEDKGNLAAVPEDKNFVQQFKKAGYQTQYVGKWHLGGGDSAPKGFGFDASFAAGEAGGTGTHFYPFNNGRAKAEKADIEDVTEAGKEGDYLADLLTTQTMDFIRKTDPNRPFFAILAHYAVHTPLEAKPDDKKRNEAEIAAHDFGNVPEETEEGTGQRKMKQNNADYAGMVENLDENIGRLLHLLDSLGIAENTIIVLTSDHGGLSNRGNKGKRELATTNLPLRAGKGHLYEGGIRVPLFLRWPNKISPKEDRENIILGMDIMPTLLDLSINASLNQVEGKSYGPVLSGSEKWDERTVFWYEKKARPHSTGDTKCAAVLSGQYKLLHFWEEKRFELYDLKNDIGETKNLINAMPEKAETLKKLLRDWQKEHGLRS